MKLGQQQFFPPFFLFLLDPGSEIQDPGLKKNGNREKHIVTATLV
jgi:hypothetical protein